MLNKNTNIKFKSYVKNHFNKISKDNEENIYLDAPFAFIKKEFFKNLSGMTILDCGCGDGTRSDKLTKFAKKVVGVDFSKKLIFAAKKKNKKNSFFYVMDIHRMKFPKETFDYIFCYKTLLYLRLDVALEEMSRVLKKKGTIIIIENISDNIIFKYYRYFKNLLLHNKFSKDFNTLKTSELKIINSFFYISQKKFFDFFSLGGFLLSKFFFKNSLILSNFLKTIDNILLNKFEFYKLAFTIVLVLKKRV